MFLVRYTIYIYLRYDLAGSTTAFHERVEPRK